METDYLEESARTTLPERKLPMQLDLGPLAADAFVPADPPVALHVTDRASGVKVDSADFDLPDGPFTLETWVMPDALQETAGIVAKTEGSEFGFHANGSQVTFLVHLGDRYASVQSGPHLKPGTWTHLAGVFDGQAVTLYLDGKPAGTTPAAGLRTRNNLPLYLGADPDQAGRPSRAFTGWIDEVRLSKGALYTADFTPARRFEAGGKHRPPLPRRPPRRRPVARPLPLPRPRHPGRGRGDLEAGEALKLTTSDVEPSGT